MKRKAIVPFAAKDSLFIFAYIMMAHEEELS